MLEIVLAQHAVTRTLRVTRELQIALVQMRGWPTDLDLGPVALKRTVGMVMATLVVIVVVVISTTAARLTTAAPLTLHWMHAIFLRGPFEATARDQGPAAKCASLSKSPFVMVRAVPSSAKRCD